MVSSFRVASLVSFFSLVLFLLPSLPCSVEAGWIPSTPVVESSKSSALCVFDSPPRLDSLLAWRSRPDSMLPDRGTVGYSTVLASKSSLLLFRSLLRKFGSFAESFRECFLEGLTISLPSTGLFTIAGLVGETDFLPPFFGDS